MLGNSPITRILVLQIFELGLVFIFDECFCFSTKEKGITKGRVISYAAQIAEGMMFLHSKASH